MTDSNSSSQQSDASHPHSKAVEDLIEQLKTDQENGLSNDEAKKRLESYGPNQLEEHDEKSLLQILIDQINNPIVYLLTAAAVLAFVFGDIPEGIAIIVVLVLNTVIGFWMEFQARKSMNALQEMDKVTANVIRGGEEQEIDAEHLVPGDIITLEAGALVPADARLIDVAELTIDEAPLTGESVPVSKDTEPIDEETQVADRKNMIFKGTAVTNGRGKAVIVTTGMETEIGSISEMVSEAEKEQIPLNRKLEDLTKRLIWVTIALAAGFFIVGWATGKEIYQLVQTAIAWTIAAIPEGLPIVASIALAKGMLRLADHNVIVKQLAAVETLGETTVIFTDKTGTLTENRLTLQMMEFEELRGEVEWSDDNKKVEIVSSDESEKSFNHEDERLKRFFEIAVLCNDAELKDEKNGEEDGAGDPLDLSLLEFGRVFNSERYESLRNSKRINEEPFDSEDMVMGTVYEIDGQMMLLCKGAAEAIVERCSSTFKSDGASDFSEEDKDKWIDRNEEFSEDGLRVIAFAFKELDQKPSEDADVEQELMQGLTFLCLTGFIDPPRKEVKESVETCRRAGIKVEMVTGDHPGTARNIAREVNVADEDNDKALHGSDLRKDVDHHDQEEVINTRIFARVDPEQKLKLIEYYQDNGDIVAMTGDGVNDAPALKKADIGIAMGERGTQVAQEVSDMVLKNDAFSSIVEAVREGRIIFGNIRKFIMYQLSYHLSEILIIAGISFSVFALPLLPLQLLFLNLLSDVFPALALGIGQGSPKIMEHDPKDPEEPIINKQNWLMIGLHGLILTIFIVGAYFFASFYWELSEEVCNNVAFFSLAFAQLWHVFDMREAEESIFDNQVTRNKYVWGAVVLCVIAIIASYYIPQINDVLSYQSLDINVWILIGITSFLPVITIQTLKEITKDSKITF
ncbi:MAG: cation-transporting P-type ATPase [Balneolaceae bacterium]|nr:cation-transporting P-type ATPase [Balneolaceae bacterium]